MNLKSKHQNNSFGIQCCDIRQFLIEWIPFEYKNNL